MKIVATCIPDVVVFEPQIFEDERGFFLESFNSKAFERIIGRKVEFVQDNHSKSYKGVLRGLHFQKPPYEQGKLVRCIVGEVYDVAVDLRLESPTYRKWVGINLSAENKRQLWIPEGFAHGFVVISETAEFVYKTTNYYSQEHESGIRWNDQTLNIDWGDISNIILSNKDAQLPTLDGKL